MSGDWAPFGTVPCRIVVAGEGDDDCVGLLLDNDVDEVVGALPFTPAARIGFEVAAKRMGMPVNWHKHEQLVQMSEDANAIGKLIRRKP
jgi:hypothetical protein